MWLRCLGQTEQAPKHEVNAEAKSPYPITGHEQQPFKH